MPCVCCKLHLPWETLSWSAWASWHAEGFTLKSVFFAWVFNISMIVTWPLIKTCSGIGSGMSQVCGINLRWNHLNHRRLHSKISCPLRSEFVCVNVMKTWLSKLVFWISWISRISYRDFMGFLWRLHHVHLRPSLTIRYHLTRYLKHPLTSLTKWIFTTATRIHQT